MYTILIVDDEYIVRSGIQSTIDWNKYDFEIIGEAETISEAYEKFLELNPDILITDIRMGNSSGLDLIEKVQATNKDTEIVVLSGYGQFDYVKKAYESGVFTYLLKPLKNDELLKKLLEIKQRLTIKRRHNVIIENVEQLRKQFIHNILTPTKISPDEFEDKCTVYSIDFPKLFSVACISIDNFYNISQDEQNKYMDILDTILNDYTSAKNGNILYTSLAGLFHLIIPVYETDEPYAKNFHIYSLIENIQEQFSAVSDGTISVGYSAIKSGYLQITEATEEAKSALFNKAWIGTSTIVDYKNLTDDTLKPLITNEFDLLTQAIINKDKAETTNIIKTLFDKIKKMNIYDFGYIQNAAIEMTVFTIHTVIKNNQYIYDIFGDTTKLYNKFRTCTDINQIYNLLTDTVDKIFCSISSNDNGSYSYETLQAIEIIKQEYSRNISIEYIAEKLFISASYLMVLFKKETGKTLHAYLTEYRINTAVKLLNTKKFKVYEVCAMVGYTDANYFSYTFKKHVGMSPKTYLGTVR